MFIIKQWLYLLFSSVEEPEQLLRQGCRSRTSRIKFKLSDYVLQATTADISKKCLNIDLVLSALSGFRGGISTNKGVSLRRSILALRFSD
jgi:hypothetical protein